MNGIVFEGGGMRGIFTSGVIDWLIDQDLRFDVVYGVSAGATNGCSFVTGQRDRAYATATEYLKDPEFAGLQSLRKTGDYFNTDFIYRRIPEELYPIDQEGFSERGMRFLVNATNCITGEADFFEIKDMHTDMNYVRASASMPLLSRIVPLDGYVYLDGGIADPLPVREAFRAGCERVVVVKTQPEGYRKKPSRAIMPLIRARYRRYPKLIRTMAERHVRYNASLDYIDEQVRAGKAFVISPMGPLDIKRTESDRNKLKKGYMEGYFVTEGIGEKLKRFLAGEIVENVRENARTELTTKGQKDKETKE